MKLLVKTAVTALKKRRWCGNFAMRVGAIFMGKLNGVFGLNWVAIAAQADRA